MKMYNVANHWQPKGAERVTSGAVFGCPCAFALLDLLFIFFKEPWNQVKELSHMEPCYLSRLIGLLKLNWYVYYSASLRSYL